VQSARYREFVVAIVDEIAFAPQKAIKMIRELPGALLHEGGIGRV
jgi:hypothetical protein